MYFINELKIRNPILFWYGCLNFVGAIICLCLIQVTDIRVNNINAFVKPLKFFLSIGVFCWTMGWIMYYLDQPSRIRRFNIMAVTVLAFEIVVITWQAANGRLSHFNVSTPFYLILFNMMGLAIVVLTLWTAYIGYLFFLKKDWNLPMGYVWGIRLGIICFVVFALEGGAMGSLLRHTIGGDDSGEGLPLVNWNRRHGDLRIAHFLGMHTLQLFPLAGYYVTKSKRSMIAFCLIYTGVVVAVLIQAILGLPLA